MKLPRDLGGDELARLLSRYGYKVVRQSGSHMRLVSVIKGTEHRITIPRHKPLRVGILSRIIAEVARYLETDRQTLSQELFGNR